jgi:pSer/pThr/pTyr-binding forkhead associated (FHA) protein
MRVKLVVVRGQPQGKSLQFPRGEFLIGRGRECYLRPNSSWVSRQHCLLCVNEHQVVLRDLGSTNGTLVNGVRVVGERNLTQGDRIQIGPLAFEVYLSVQQSAASQLAGQTDANMPTLETDEAPALSRQPNKPQRSPAVAEFSDTSLTQPR